MPGQYSLDTGGVGRDEYARLLAENMKRYGGDRDRAVRSANIAGGFGNSTAQRFMRGAGAPPASAASGPASAVPTPQARPAGPAAAAQVPIPQPRPDNFPPDLAVSPPRGDMMWPGATGGPATQPTVAPPPMNPALSMASMLRSVPPELVNDNPLHLPPLMRFISVPPELGGKPPEAYGRRAIPKDPRYPIAGSFG